LIDARAAAKAARDFAEADRIRRELADQGIELKDTPRARPGCAPDHAAFEAASGAVTPEYWDDACRHLSRRDRVMKKLIPKFGEARLQSRGDAFTTLARSIVGQQISVKAAQSVWDRFAQAVGGPSHRLDPSAVLVLDTPALRAAGLSARKAEYLGDLARHFDAGTVHVRQWQQMDDEAIIDELVAIRGIGRWTAEMFLIFHLMRPDVLPLDDLGLVKGISVNYFSGEPVSRAEVREIGDAWAPFRSVATWYIWRSLDPLPVEY
jgi:DNA-3-methyladenine glycosylase II